MKKIDILAKAGHALGKLFAHAFASPTSSVTPKRGRLLTGSALRNAGDIRQAARIEAAAAKRAHRAERRSFNAGRATACYLRLREAHLTLNQVCTFDQLYIAK